MKDFKSVGKDVGGNEGDVCLYTYRLDTYGNGCAHDCSYCYAKSLLDFRKLWNPKNPAIGQISDISKQIRNLRRKGIRVVRLGGMTDCFQPAEKLHRTTYKTIKLLNKYKIEYLIITKSDMVADPAYLEVMDKGLAHIQMTLTFTDDDKYRESGIEKAPLPSQRIKAIETLEQQGFDVAIRLSPYIPEYIDIDVLNKIKCDKMLVEFLRVNHWTRQWLGTGVDLSKYTRNFHGYSHLPFKEKKRLVEQLGEVHTVTVCDFEPEYLDYWKKDFNPNKDDCCNLRRPNATKD